MEFLIILAILLKIGLGVTIYMIRNLLKQNEQLEESTEILVKRDEQYAEWFLNFKKEIDRSAVQLKQIDRKGSFEADDEIGFVFKEIKKIQGRLNEYFK